MNVFHQRFSLVASVKVSLEFLMQTCWWPLSDHWSVQPTSPNLSGFVFYGCLENLTELSALWLPFLSICNIFSEYYCPEYFLISINNILQYPVWAQPLGQWLITSAPTVNGVGIDMCIFNVSPDYLPWYYAFCINRVIYEVVMSSQLTAKLQLAALRHPVIVMLAHQR